MWAVVHLYPADTARKVILAGLQPLIRAGGHSDSQPTPSLSQPGPWPLPACTHLPSPVSFSRPFRHFALQLARASAALVSSFRR